MFGLLLLNLIIGNGDNGTPASFPIIFIFMFIGIGIIKIWEKFD